MKNQTDSQLLRAYAQHGSEPAFTELVRRHVDLVYSAALRMVCDSHLAEDVTQGVFLALAKSLTQLTDRPVLSGWLHRTAQNIAAQTVRTDVRRRARELEAAAMNEILCAESDAAWNEIASHLDEALGELGEPDRDALLLRYFERKSAGEMAQILGISDVAAQKRVSRAVERLRDFLVARGVTIGAGGLAVVISANAVQAAPVGLAISISTAAVLTGTSLATTATVTTTKAIAMTAIQKTIVAATIAVLAGAGIYEAKQASKLGEQVLALQQQRESQKAEEQQQLETQQAQLAALTEENERLKSDASELLRLRAEITRMKAEPAKTTPTTPTTRGTSTGAEQVSTSIRNIRTSGLSLEQTEQIKNSLLDSADMAELTSKIAEARKAALEAALDKNSTDAVVREKVEAVAKIQVEIGMLRYLAGVKAILPSFSEEQKSQIFDVSGPSFNQIFVGNTSGSEFIQGGRFRPKSGNGN